MTRHYFRLIQEHTVLSVLLYVRAEAMRDEKDGADHAEALLRLRGYDPNAYAVSAKVPNHFRRGALTRIILKALGSAPLPGRSLAEAVQAAAGDMEFELAYRRTYGALDRLKKAGVVERDAGLWRLRNRPDPS